jgi:hypothetical protein
MADVHYHNIDTLALNGDVDLAADTTKVVLLTDSYTPSADHTVYSDVSSYEVANGHGYTTGGVEVAMTVTDDDANDGTTVDSADPSWTASGGSIGPFRYAAWYDDTHASNVLIHLFDFGSNQTANDGASITITIDSNGLYYIRPA